MRKWWRRKKLALFIFWCKYFRRPKVGDQYGDFFISNDPMPEGEARQLLECQMRETLVLLRVIPKDCEFTFNLPYESYDEDTGEVFRGFSSSWKFTVLAKKD